jgi:hypothetical protein
MVEVLVPYCTWNHSFRLVVPNPLGILIVGASGLIGPSLAPGWLGRV